MEHEVDSWMLVALLRLHFSAIMAHLMHEEASQSSSHYEFFYICRVNDLDDFSNRKEAFKPLTWWTLQLKCLSSCAPALAGFVP